MRLRQKGPDRREGPDRQEESAEGGSGGSTSGIPRPGHVEIRGPSVITAYGGNRHTVTASTADGWPRTGDLGTLDEDGYLYLIGRTG